MPQVNSFKDRFGKSGKIGSKVYHWMLELEEKLLDERKIKEAQTVEEIYSRGAAGTKLTLSGESGSVKATDYVILGL